ncbi:MAG: DUF4403 family protein [Minicystis sp.]
MIKTSLLRAALVALALGTSACGSTIPPYTVNVKPRLDNIRPPRSIAFVRDDVPLGGLRSAIDGAVGETVAGKKKTSLLGRDLEIDWRLARKPVVLRAEPGGLAMEIILAGKVAAHGDGVKCHADDVTVTFRTEARPGLKPNGDIGFAHFDWKPKTHANLRCDGIPIPADTVIDAVTQPLLHALATGVGKIELPTGSFVKKALDQIRPARPLKLGGKNEDVCLDLAPDALVLSPVGGSGETMKLKVGVEVAPRIVLGACPPSGAAAKQPSVVAKNVPLKDHFEIQVAVAVPYTELTTLVTPSLKGKRFGNSDHGVEVDAIEIGDASGRTLVHLTVHGSLDGDIYLWGTPTIVEEKGRFHLRIPDLQVAVESRSILERIGLAVWKAVGGGLEGILKEKLTMDVTDKLAQARAGLTGRRVLTEGPPKPVLTTNLESIRAGEATSKPGVMILMPVLVGTADFAVE